MSKNLTGNGDPDNPGNVDKIRDILFGTQMRDYDKRFSKLEERLLKEASNLREEIQRRFASLEAHLKNEIAALAERDKLEQTQRTEAIKEVTREIKESTRAWEKRSGQLDDQQTKAQRELRNHVLAEAKRLTDDLEKKLAESRSLLDKESQNLRGALIDRLNMADLFSEISLRLKNEFKVPHKG